MEKQSNPMHPEVRDFGPVPIVFNIEHATEKNTAFRRTLWSGQHLQLTLMSIPVGSEIGAEMHNSLDQFLRVEDGRARVYTGASPNALSKETDVADDAAIISPAGTWHNVVNIGTTPLKLYSLYAPPAHPYGTVHLTKEDAENAER